MKKESVIGAQASATTALAISSAARALYARASFFYRMTNRYRPFLCPYEIALAEVPLRARVLDVGCGAGLWLALLAQQRALASGLGLDVSAPAIGAAQQMARDGGLADVLSFAQAGNLAAIAARSFPVVTMIDVLHHVPARDQRTFFLEAAARVEPHGRLIFKDMAEGPWYLALCNTLQDLLISRQLVHYVSAATALGWAREAGLTLRLSRVDRRACFAHRLMVFEAGAGDATLVPRRDGCER